MSRQVSRALLTAIAVHAKVKGVGYDQDPRQSHFSAMTMAVHCYLAVGWMALLGSAALPAHEPLTISVYATAGDVNRYLNAPEAARWKEMAAAVKKRASRSPTDFDLPGV